MPVRAENGRNEAFREGLFAALFARRIILSSNSFAHRGRVRTFQHGGLLGRVIE